MKRRITICQCQDGWTSIWDAETGERLNRSFSAVVMIYLGGGAPPAFIDLPMPDGFEVTGEVEWPDDRDEERPD